MFSFDSLRILGAVNVVAFLVVLVLVIRPLSIWLSTAGNRDFDHLYGDRERAFLAWTGYRGVTPASLAVLFSMELAGQGIAQADLVMAIPLLVIAWTVLLQGTTARFVPDLLRIVPNMIMVVGGGKMGWYLAENLASRGENVILLEKDEKRAKELNRRDSEVTVKQADGTNLEALREYDAEAVTRFVAATDRDDHNILAAILAGTNFDIPNLYARLEDPASRQTVDDLKIHARRNLADGAQDGDEDEDEETYEKLEIHTVSPALESASWISDKIRHPGLRQWLDELDTWGRGGDVREIEVKSSEWDGGPVGEFQDRLDDPSRVMIPLVNKADGERVLNPDDDVELEVGDTLTVLGEAGAIKRLQDNVN